MSDISIDNKQALLSLLRENRVAQVYVYHEFFNGRDHKNLQTVMSNNPKMTDEILYKLIEKGNIALHFNLIKKSNLSSEIIKKIAETKLDRWVYRKYMSIAIRLAMTKHNNTPLEVLEKLASDLNYNVRIAAREAMAKHPNTSLEVLEELAFDAELKVKKAVALRSDLPITLIVKMATDRQIIAKKFLLRNRSFEVQLAVVKNHKTTSKMLIEIGLNSYDVEILITILENKNTPQGIKETILEKISAFPSFSVLEYVARSPYTSQDILISWSYSKYYSLLHSIIAQNPNTPENIAKKLAKQHKFTKVTKYLPGNPNTPQNILIRYSKYNRGIYDQSLLKNPNLPLLALENILERKSKSIYVCDRKFVARHPKTPTPILEKLTQDQNIGVRDAAKYRLDQRNL